MRWRIKPLLLGGILLAHSFSLLSMSQPVSGLAGIPGAVRINEFSSHDAADWVELYNTTLTAVDPTNWQIKNVIGDSHTIVMGTIEAHGFLLVNVGDFLDETADTIQLADDEANAIDEVSYGSGALVPASTSGHSSGRIMDGGLLWNVNTPTPSATNVTDLLSPTVPSGGAPDDTAATTHDFNFTWQPSQDLESEVRYEFRASTNAALVGNVSDAEGAVISGPLSTPEMSFQSVAGKGDGQWYWQVRALDAVENRSDWSNVWSVLVDSTGPILTINSPSEGGLYGGPGASQVGFSATMTDVSGIATPFRLERDGVDVTDQLTVAGGASSMTLSATFESNSFADGDHVLRLFASDVHGNSSELLRSFSVDGSAPIISTNIVQNQIVRGIVSVDSAANDPRLTVFSMTILDGNDDPIVLDDAKDDLKEWTANEIQASTVLHYDWDTTNVLDGTYLIRFFAKDQGGNESIVTRSVVVDNIVDLGLGVVPGEDPLLSQLSRQLTQPFPFAQGLTTAPFVPENAIQRTQDAIVAKVEADVPETDQGARTVAVAPSEEGWRIFGVAWYWWTMLLLATGFTVYRWRSLYQTPEVSPRFEEV